MYCSETWVLTKVISSSLKSAVMKAVRRVIGVTYKDRVTNEAGFIDLHKLHARSRLQ